MGGKVVNFGSGNPVWRTGNGVKWNFETDNENLILKNSIGAIIYIDSSGFIKRGEWVYTSCLGSGANSTSKYGYCFYAKNLGYAKRFHMQCVSTEDNGDETFNIPYSDLAWNGFIQAFLQVRNSDKQLIIKEVTANDFTITRTDASGEEIEFDILFYTF